MANKITRNVAEIDPNMIGVKESKRKSINSMDQSQKMKEGGDWSGRGFGTETDMDRIERQRNYAKADYIEPPLPTLDDFLSGKGEPDPVKKPTMRNVGVKEPTKKYLGHFANDYVLQCGHNVSDPAMLAKMSANKEREPVPFTKPNMEKDLEQKNSKKNQSFDRLDNKTRGRVSYKGTGRGNT